MKHLSCSLLLLTSAAACSGSPGEQICARQAALTCQFVFDCCNASERAQILNLNNMPSVSVGSLDNNAGLILVPIDSSANRSDCEDRLTNACTAQSSALDVAVDEERVKVDVDQWETCYQGLTDAVNACDATAVMNFSASATECRSYRTGQVGTNGVCYESFECSNNARCQMNGQNQMDNVSRLTGTCGDPMPLALEGQDCSDRECDPTFYCANGGMGARTCATYAQRGQACGGNNDRPCDPNQSLECQGNTCSARAQTTHDYCKGSN